MVTISIGLLLTQTISVHSGYVGPTNNVGTQPTYIPDAIRDSDPVGPESGSFVKNVGQFPDEVKFLALTDSGVLSIFDDGFNIEQTNPYSKTLESPQSRSSDWTGPEIRSVTNIEINTPISYKVRIKYINSSDSQPRGTIPSAHYVNYFHRDQTNWYTRVPSYGRIEIEQLYPGIDLSFYIEDGELKYEFALEPQADASMIQFNIEGDVDDLVVFDDHVVITTPVGEVSDKGLVTFYEDAPSEEIPCRFDITSQGFLGYSLGDYNKERPIVIDPMVVSSLSGGSNDDWISDLAIGDEGVIYIAASTSSFDYSGVSTGINLGETGGPYDVAISAISHDGKEILWITYIGGTGPDYVTSLQLDADGNLVVLGDTGSTDFPTTPNGYDRILDGSMDSFILKINPNGDRMMYSTLLGGNSSEISSELGINEDGSIYVTGITNSIDFPTSIDALYGNYSGGSWDVYCSVLSSDLSSMKSSTYIGAGAEDYASDIGSDANGNLIITGYTRSEDFRTTDTSYQSEHAGSVDAFIYIISKDLKSQIYSTLIGGSGSDFSTSLVVTNDSLYITGRTWSPDYPVTANAIKKTKGTDSFDIFVTQISSDLSDLISSTYLGGRNEDWVNDIEVDSDGFIYIAGTTGSINFPITDGAYMTSYQGGTMDAFITVLDQNTSVIRYSSFLGGSLNEDVGLALELDEMMGVYIVGKTKSTDFPVSQGAFQKHLGGEGWDGFIIKLLIDFKAPIANAGPDLLIDQYMTTRLNGSQSTDNAGIIEWRWSFIDNGQEIILFGPNPDYSFINAGTFNVTLVVKDLTGHSDTDGLIVSVIDITSPAANGGQDITIDQHQIVVFNGSASTDNVGITEWTWFFTLNGHEITLFGPVPSQQFDEAGTYEVVLTVFDAVGNFGTDNVTVYVVDITQPIAEAGPDIYIDQGQKAWFNGSGSIDNVEITEWLWSINIGSKDTLLEGKLQNLIFEEAGAFKVTLEISDKHDNVADDILYVHVRDIEAPVPYAGPDKQSPQGSKLTLDASKSQDNVGIVRYLWNITAEGLSYTLEGKEVTKLFDSPGKYTILLIVFDQEGNWAKDSAVIWVIDTIPPNARAKKNVTIQAGMVANMDGSDSEDNVGIQNWSWTFTYLGQQIYLEGVISEFRFDRAGEYIITLNCTDEAGNSGKTTMNVTVVPMDGETKSSIPTYLLLIVVIAAIITSIMLVRWARTPPDSSPFQSNDE